MNIFFSFVDQYYHFVPSSGYVVATAFSFDYLIVTTLYEGRTVTVFGV